jgi:RNA polymerase sigma-70 factor, ECF subfamily
MPARFRWSPEQAWRLSFQQPTREPEARDAETADAAGWVEKVRNGDHDAFQAMFCSYYAPLVSFVNGYLRSQALAEEVVQEVFLQVWKNRERWVVRDSPRAYLYGAARNHALDQLRRRRVAERWRTHTLQTPDALDPKAPGTPETELEDAELGEAIDRAIASLPERARMAATLRWRHQLSYAEIAEAMGITAKGVENQLGRVAKTLRTLLSSFRP